MVYEPSQVKDLFGTGSYCRNCFLYPAAHFQGTVCPDRTSVPCIDCKQPIMHTPVTQTERGVVCPLCQADAAHKARGCTHAMDEWCPLRGADPFKPSSRKQGRSDDAR